jgi:hypothetical protein
MSYPGFPLVPPFAVTASYQTKQYGSGSIYTPGVPSVFGSLVSPPTSGTTAETASDTDAHTVGFSAFSAANEVAVITLTGSPAGGTFTLAWGDANTSPIAYNASAATVQSALDALSSVPGATGGTNEVQTVTVTGGPAGGTFTLTYSGQTTAGIAFNAAASAVQSALVALSNIDTADVLVTGSAGGPYTVTFRGALADTNVAQMTASGASLTGGTSPGVTVATQTAGVAQTQNITVTGSNGGPWTATFGNLLGDLSVADLRGDGAGLTGGTNPNVSIVVTTQGTAAFVNEALQDAHRHRDAMYDFYDQSSGMHF